MFSIIADSEARFRLVERLNVVPRKVLFIIVTCCLTLLAAIARADRPNVLFIAIDDLRVELGCYGQTWVKSPHIDRLAAGGMLFERAYCQQTVCNPSRASLLTGMRPDTLRVWDLPTHFRQNVPDAVTLPELFKTNGYHTQCVGKIFHNWRQDDWKGDPRSWSVPSVLHYNSHSNDKPLVDGVVPPNLASGKGGIECRDVPDDAYFDGRVAQTAVATMRDLSRGDQPFFLAVGFWKPHRPFNAPKKYWDLYDRNDVPIPNNVQPPKDVPDLALTSARFSGGAASDALREMHHGHLAAISYLDAQVGRVLDELDALGLRDDTIVVLWSDHGLHLGEHGLTRKTTAFELDARIPLIIDAPKHPAAGRTKALVELLDLYPTLAELAGLQAPEDVEGVSLMPLLDDPSNRHHEVALTQTPRPNYPRGKLPEVMGYSIRSQQFRYTEWRDFPSKRVLARELYDHRTDPHESVNVAERDEHQSTIAELVEKLSAKLAARPTVAASRPDKPPHPLTHPTSPHMLDLVTSGSAPSQIDFANLPHLPSQHAVISDVRDRAGTWVHQHAYLTHFDDKYWAMWSDGPGVPKRGLTPQRHRNVVPGHDRPDTRVSYATSEDGLHWSEPADLSGPPRREGFGWIARGLWVREGELLALASHFNAPGYPGKGLSLEAFRWDASEVKWKDHGTVLDDTLNNFPPKRLPQGEFMMTRRDHRQQVSVMIGGDTAYDDWNIHPLASYDANGRPEEPYWYVLPDEKNLVGLIRDNGRSGRLLRTFSCDNGRTWSPIVKTNFPDATSKFFVLRTSRGYYAMVSNSNPDQRDPLTLAISADGLVFTHLFRLVGGRHVDYPHLIEHDGHLLIAFSGAKQTMEVLKVSMDDVDAAIGSP
ncbi:Arylsulfatase [Stieleria maiorica]|uniref:Arylsulfatase n=1 Tax=Stieleria maiorica TaxID=2795974 RepID=A0A5B9MPY8_9BACT|nr:Arylsulfatase [Stieleria maiorica]